MNTGMASLSARGSIRGESAVGRDAAGDADAACEASGPPEGAIDERIDDDALKRRAEVGHLLRRRVGGIGGRANPVATGTPRSDKWRTTALFKPEKLNSAKGAALPAETAKCDLIGRRRIPVGVGQPARGRSTGGVSSELRNRSMAASAGSRGRQPRDFIVRFAAASSLVPSDQAIHAGLRHDTTDRCGRRDHEHRRGQRKRPCSGKSTRCARAR